MPKKNIYSGIVTNLTRDLFPTEAVMGWEQVTGPDWTESMTEWTNLILQRPGLDLKTRILMGIAMLGVQLDPGSERHLIRWIKAAQKNGIKPEEIREILIMVEVYGGSARCRRALEIFGEEQI